MTPYQTYTKIAHFHLICGVKYCDRLVCLIRLSMSQSTIFQLCRDGSSLDEPVLSRPQGHNTVRLVRLEPATPQPGVKHSTTVLPYCNRMLNREDLFRSSHI